MKTTKHTCGGPSFGRLTSGCPRCEELKAGAKPVQWRKSDEARQIREIREHDCRVSGCGPVCTFGDW